MGLVRAALLIAVALTTTGMGTLMPILRDSGELGTRFGAYVVAAGAMGEFGPIVLLSVIMTREHTRWLQTALMAFFAVCAPGGRTSLGTEAPENSCLYRSHHEFDQPVASPDFYH